MKIKIFKNAQTFFGNCFCDGYHIFLFKNKERISFTWHYNIFENMCNLLKNSTAVLAKTHRRVFFFVFTVLVEIAGRII